MTCGWREEFRSDGLYHELMLSESLEQFRRNVAAATPLLRLLEAIHQDPSIAWQVVSYARSLLAEPLAPGVLSETEVPLSCSAHVLSQLGLPEGRAVVEELAQRHEPELRWAPVLARLLLGESSPTTMSLPTVEPVAAGMPDEEEFGLRVMSLTPPDSDFPLAESVRISAKEPLRIAA